jgi:hypothetical protein
MLGLTKYTTIRFNISVRKKNCTRKRRFKKTLCRICGFVMTAENKNIQLAEVSGTSGIEQPLL